MTIVFCLHMLLLPSVVGSPAPLLSKAPESRQISRSRTPESPHAYRGITFGDNGGDLLLSRHNHSFRLQQMEIEDRATKLLQKNAELEEELASYKEYMKKSVMTLTKQKRDLEAQLRTYQNSMKKKSGLPGSSRLSKGTSSSSVHQKNGAFMGLTDSPEDSEKLDSFEESANRVSDGSDAGSDYEDSEPHQTVDNKRSREKKRG